MPPSPVSSARNFGGSSAHAPASASANAAANSRFTSEGYEGALLQRKPRQAPQRSEFERGDRPSRSRRGVRVEAQRLRRVDRPGPALRGEPRIEVRRYRGKPVKNG